jgi:transketolase
MAVPALEAAELLGRRGIRATVAVVSSLNPSPLDDLAELLGSVPLALAAEAHYESGGLGSLVAEIIAERGLECRLVRAGVRSMPAGVTGSSAYMLERLGLSAERLAGAATQALAGSF